MLSLRELRVYRGDAEIIRGISAKFQDGKVHVILGVNGSGKSTLAGGIMGIYPATGNIFLDGERIDGLSITDRANRGITLAFQEPAKFEGIRVKDYLLASSRDKTLSELYDTIKLVGLPNEILSKKMDDSLSGGERKRIELASVLLMHPKIAILDEPDSGIDMVSYGRIIDATRILRDNGASVILITHNKEILELGDVAHVLCNGKLVMSGTPNEIREFFEKKFSGGDYSGCD